MSSQCNVITNCWTTSNCAFWFCLCPYVYWLLSKQALPVSKRSLSRQNIGPTGGRRHFKRQISQGQFPEVTCNHYKTKIRAILYVYLMFLNICLNPESGDWIDSCKHISEPDCCSPARESRTINHTEIGLAFCCNLIQYICSEWSIIKECKNC